ncbi:tRNA 2-selenouridine(34) synthase MnmH [Limimaricola hongkongensis]|uniref:Selenophosphate-dependent tRNA 2-selenouridine synthase n=1 Tax=Limimaricola hongkongensis DSM 17492 TaxID=1122180 RepID=A0A017HG30_9RHOB|nr:tRNA 2-selenouridine(34) synthase MnmH [Limimaricola hongkongensis]EYD73078.1 Selenophosphate-dependent tRNA 2-selenouridine synthase [Limimaricola hongkongensis DSM 17492]
MSIRFDTIAAFLDHGFDDVIDVRSPAEFAEDHVPGAINLPVLSNAERAEVGTIYKQVSPFDARKIGAAIVSRNAADHIAGPLADREYRWRPLVYCWRGGQRSNSFASILTQIGWRAEVVTGGYQSWRRLVHDALYVAELPHRLVLLDGFTGTAKTALLPRVEARGGQVLDLEGLAHHRGSLLGGDPEEQPAQKGFESRLAERLARLDPERPVLVEAESSKIGRITLPPALWAVMTQAPRIEITAPIGARAEFLARQYEDVSADPARLSRLLDQLRAHRGHEVVDGWQALLAQRRMVELSAALMAEHYDPAYARSRAAHDPQFAASVAAATLDAAGLDRAADEIAAAMRAI